MIWHSPGLPGWQKVNLITVTRRPHHLSIAAGLYCLTTSPGILPALCEKWSGFFYVHRVLLSYTRDRRLKVSSERLGNEDKAPCPRTLLPGGGLNRGPPVWKSEVLTTRPRQLHNIFQINVHTWSVSKAKRKGPCVAVNEHDLCVLLLCTCVYVHVCVVSVPVCVCFCQCLYVWQLYAHADVTAWLYCLYVWPMSVQHNKPLNVPVC